MMGTKRDQQPDKVTLQTVAEKIGVSKTTVSNAYSRPDQLAPALREQILKAAKELGYAGPNAAARSLRLGRINVFGLLVMTTLSYTVSDPAAVQLLQGIARIFDKHELSLLALPGPTNDPESGVQVVRNAVVDGFLVYGVPESDPRFKAVLDRKIPVVTIDEPKIAGSAYVGIDDEGGARKIATHLIELGHRRFGILSLPISDPPVGGFIDQRSRAAIEHNLFTARLRGYEDVIKSSGIDIESIRIYECKHNSREHGARWTSAMLDQSDPPTAILATSDLLAFGAMREAERRGLHVPGDLSIAGFDDVPEAQFSQPPLTTVRQPLRQKGIEAARLLAEGWEGEQPPHVMLQTELVVRGTTGPAPA